MQQRPDLSWIPSVDAVLRGIGDTDFPRPMLLAVTRRALNDLRSTAAAPLKLSAVIQRVRLALDSLHANRLRPVINGTGVIIHTNLGRSPMSEVVARSILEIATQYNTLEYDLAVGERGGRGAYLEHNLALICEAEAATIVNNCAAALVLILHTLAGRGSKNHVIISRGELVQIGGGFRVPEILEASGATLREVGTTNQTAIDDYRYAVDERTAMILKVHRSNFHMSGFVASPSTQELAALAHEFEIPFVEDLGSGATFDSSTIGDGSEHEPTPAAILQANADLVCFSGDKLLGGPQAGIIAGKTPLIAKLKQSPLFRAFRCDKLTMAGMQATVDLLLQDRDDDIPTHAMLHIPVADLRVRAGRIVEALKDTSLKLAIGDGISCVGGGALPNVQIASITLDIAMPNGRADRLAADLRQAATPIIGYVNSDQFRLDLRTIFPHQDESVIRALRNLAGPNYT